MLKSYYFYILSVVILITACARENEQSNTNTELKIDKLINHILDTAQVYDISFSLRYTKDNVQYDVVQYEQNDSIKLLVTNSINLNSEINRQYFLNQNKLTHVIEHGTTFNGENYINYDKKVYFINDNTIKTYFKNLDEDKPEYKLIEDTTTYTTNKAIDAINQKGDFEMKFGEFLIIEPQTYLILDNKKSKYSVALFITEGDFLLDDMYENQKKYKGKTIFANHEFVTMNGITRMVYKGAYLIEKN